MTSPTLPGLVPQPTTVTAGAGTLRLAPQFIVALEPALAGARHLLADIFQRRLGLQLAWAPDAAASPPAHLTLALDPARGPEGYRLEVAQRITITAGGTPGALHALRTLQQLAGPGAFRTTPIQDPAHHPVTLPHLTIEDAPRMGHRGVLLDVARHFMPKDSVLRFIELASAHKLNVLHLHLTDDQGWRAQINAYPRLTEVGAWREQSQLGSSRSTLFDGRPHGGFYTQDDLREIVAFARTRGMQVIPEVDIPGHSQAAMAAYPHLATGGQHLDVWTRWGLNPHTLAVTDEVLDFYRTVLDELGAIFDSPIICLGGDEVPDTEWAADPTSQKRVADAGLAGPAELLPWFVGQLAEHLASLGRRAEVWDEVGGQHLPGDAVVLAWRGYDDGIRALRAGHDVIMCPEHEVYLDHREAPGLGEPVPVGTVHTLEDVYRFDPLSHGVADAAAAPGAGRVLGAQANVWSEQLDSPRRVDYAAYPRLSAFAEAVWSDPAVRSWPDFSRRLTRWHLPRLDAAGVEYRPLGGPLPWQQVPGSPGWPLRFDEGGTLVHAPDGAA